MANHRVHEDSAYVGTTPQMRYWKARVRGRKEAGLCPRCPEGNVKPLMANYALCEEHLTKARTYYKPRRVA